MAIFLQSVARRLKSVSEIIVVRIGDNKNHQHGHIKYIGYDVVPPESATAGGFQHAMCLHIALEEVTQSLVLFSDPDIFFYAEADQIYLDLMKAHNLDVVGISHQDAVSLAHRFFPVVTNMLVKKDRLPPATWLKNEIKMAMGYKRDDEKTIGFDGKYLIPGAVPSQVHKYPNPDGSYETGNLLLPWSQENNWRWLSFQTTDCHRYSLAYNRGNFKLPKPLPKQLLLYHGTHGVTLDHKREAFINAYKENLLAPTHGTTSG